MKTPLSQAILDNWSLDAAPKFRLSVSDLLEQESSKGRHVGLIIDLSNHETLYAEDVPPNVAYQHVQLVAKVFPLAEQVKQVIDIAERFWEQHPDEYIAIHCAYGFNRTGFVVCSYLVQACGLTVDEALKAFAAARPPGVKHERFVAELHERYAHCCAHSHSGSTSPKGRQSPEGGEQRAARPVPSLGSLTSDFRSVAEHLGRQRTERLRASLDEASRSKQAHSSRRGHQHSSVSDIIEEGGVQEAEVSTPQDTACSSGRQHRITPANARRGSALGTSHSSGISDNESLGFSLSHAMSELQHEDSDLVTNPSLGFGVAELQGVMQNRQRTPPREVVRQLPTIGSGSSLNVSTSSLLTAESGSARSPAPPSPFAMVEENAEVHGLSPPSQPSSWCDQVEGGLGDDAAEQHASSAQSENAVDQEQLLDCPGQGRNPTRAGHIAGQPMTVRSQPWTIKHSKQASPAGR